ncbi:polysaccharide deacetylase family protein [Oceanobacillus damuensis]|uniref:polysaccharide deacetylase family protein n=1 Tax=Oceanobacillus damuensis TaxID=937928 RepID=UPI00083524E9|nr:polysaccharide deacetylase family protein [Oceanobacillus damuensis]
MNRFFISFLIIGLVFLTACADDSGTASKGKTKPANTEKREEKSDERSEEIPEGKVSEEASDDVETDESEAKPEAQYILTENWSLVPIEEGIEENVVLLTIDDAPDKHAVDMAKTLNELDAPAIFFVNGHFLDSPEEEEMLKEIHDLGFEIGNHTYNHVVLPELTEEEQKQEIVSLSDRIEEIIGERPVFFRAPHGANTDYSKEVAQEEGMTVINWSYGYDYFKPYMEAEKLIEAMVSGEGPEVGVDYSLLNPGANLLMHDRPWTAEALPDIVNGLRDKGFEMLDPILIKSP